jgi:hypothetical protein
MKLQSSRFVEKNQANLISKINTFKVQNRTFRENERNASISSQNKKILQKLIGIEVGKKTVASYSDRVPK